MAAMPQGGAGVNFFHQLFKTKLAAIQAAAPRATIRMFHESEGFSVYLDEAAKCAEITGIGRMEDHAEDVLEASVLRLFVPLADAVQFVEAVTQHHSVAMVDVALANRVNAAQHVMYAYFPWKVKSRIEDVDDLGSIKLSPPAKEDDSDFWG
jgi:hypothetical protein